MPWRNKAILITGGSAGLGRAIALAFARQGASVAILARDETKLAATSQEIKAAGGIALPIVADIIHQDQVEAAVAQTVGQFGKLDVLVNAAGKSARGDLQSLDAQTLRELLDLNVVALANVTRIALPHLLRAQGHVINIGSLASKIAPGFLGAYSLTKHAVAAYSQQLRLEVGPQGVHVLLVCPGPIARDIPRKYDIAAGADIPASSQLPAGGAKVNAIDLQRLAEKILAACAARRAECIVPAKARLLFVLNQISPRLGDWLLAKFMRGPND
jgi:short-subunit dehydrogenase